MDYNIQLPAWGRNEGRSCKHNRSGFKGENKRQRPGLPLFHEKDWELLPGKTDRAILKVLLDWTTSMRRQSRLQLCLPGCPTTFKWLRNLAISDPGYLELFLSGGCFGRCFGFPPRCGRLTHLHPTPAPLLSLILRFFPSWVSQFIYFLLLLLYYSFKKIFQEPVWVNKWHFRGMPVRLRVFLIILYHQRYFWINYCRWWGLPYWGLNSYYHWDNNRKVEQLSIIGAVCIPNRQQRELSNRWGYCV